MIVVKVSQISSCCGVVLCLLTACGQTPSKSADDKLASIISQVPPPVASSPDMPVPTPLAYQASKDPFMNPYRTVQSSGGASGLAAVTSHQTTTQADSATDKAGVGDMINQHTGTSVGQKPVTIAAASSPSDKTTSAKGVPVHIDSMRVRQPLEQYDLATLRYQGILFDTSRMVALITAPDGRVHEVVLGQYLGRHHGRVTHINTHRIELTEAILGEDGRYYAQQTFIPFIRK